ncbi:UDP-N-acetylmuramoyl-tripeptide--D-alanyl-D-alanine ligase [Capnocytophaga bilenii]
MKDLYEKFIASSGVCTDTRKIGIGSIYFALKGASFDGNAFAEEALTKGAAFAVIDNPAYMTSDKMILVPDVLTCLQQLATHHRRQMGTLVIAITGSNGKTTTKELIKAVLSQQLQVIATEGNLNNNIGVPLTLLRIKPTHDLAIVEMGANHPNEIATLCQIAEPDYGYITSIGKAHLEGFGSFQGVINTKAELYNYLRAHHKTIITNADNAITEGLLQGYDLVYRFGSKQGADLLVELLNSQPVMVRFGNSAERIQTEKAIEEEPLAANTFEGFASAPTEATSHLVGSYNFSNVAAAIAFGRYFKLSDGAIKRGIESYVPQNNRSELLQWKGNTVLLDAYNANPSSMAAAIDNIVTMKAYSKKVIVLGDMFELGDYAGEEHQRIVDMLAAHYWEGVYLVGKHFACTKSVYPKYETFEAFYEAFQKANYKDCLILIKGSRGMAMERAIK